MEQKQYCYQYPHPALTADCVVIARKDNQTYVLLVKRKNEPYKDCWAFPGGFMEIDETTEACAKRELAEETNIRAEEIRLIGIYSEINRDPRDRVVTAAYFTEIEFCDATAGDDAKQVQWFNIENLPPLAFDHDRILADAKRKYL